MINIRWERPWGSQVNSWKEIYEKLKLRIFFKEKAGLSFLFWWWKNTIQYAQMLCALTHFVQKVTTEYSFRYVGSMMVRGQKYFGNIFNFNWKIFFVMYLSIMNIWMFLFLFQRWSKWAKTKEWFSIYHWLKSKHMIQVSKVFYSIVFFSLVLTIILKE